jgi:hypothetical protein
MNNKKEYIKITIQDIEIAEEFFDNEKHFNEFLINVFKYYRGKETTIKTKIVAKYFKSYMKTMNFVIDSRVNGLKGYLAKSNNQEVKALMVEPPLEVVVDTNIISNNINNKLLSEIEISDVEDNLKKYFEIAKNFQELFIQNLTEKSISAVTQKNAKFKNYVTPIRLMIENNECTLQDLRDVWSYLSSPKAEFWKKNILSTTKLREQIVKLIFETKKIK